MFTGIIQTVAEVASLDLAPPQTPGPARLTVRARTWDHRPKPGDSIAVNGCCLTLADAAQDGLLAFDVIPQTLALTTLGGLKAGSRVNLEHAARLDTLMGGHMVQGHVDGLGRVVGVRDTLGLGEGGEYRLEIAPAAGLMEFAIPKGSVTVAGVSLTLAAVEPKGGPNSGPHGTGTFEVALIPVTLEETTLGDLVVGDAVNLEMDVMAKTIIHWLQHYGQGHPAPFPPTPSQPGSNQPGRGG